MEDDKEEKEKEEKIENKRPDLSKLEHGCDWACSIDGGTC